MLIVGAAPFINGRPNYQHKNVDSWCSTIYKQCRLIDGAQQICSYDLGLTKPLPTSSYALVSRDILCHCHLQIGLTYVLKSIAACNITKQPTLEYTVNLAFMDYFYSFWKNGTLSHIPLAPTMQEITFPLLWKITVKIPNLGFMAQICLKHLQI